MEKYIKRATKRRRLWEVLAYYNRRMNEWQTLKTVCVVEGLTGSGKTTYLINYFKGKTVFYFSFAGLIDSIAEKLFTKYVTEQTGISVTGWEDGFSVISKKYKYILFDDVSTVLSSERFRKALYYRMITNIYTRPFVVLVTQPTDHLNGLMDSYDDIWVDYFSVSEMIKLYPMLSKFDILGLCTVSGGIPKILNRYDIQKSFEENIRDILKPPSVFYNLMPELLSKYFRTPESYHYILYVIANGNQTVSEIGKFTGFAYNKCDNYLSALVKCGFVNAEKTISKRGTEKTAYRLANSYFRLWYLYVYRNRTELQLGNEEVIGNIINKIISTEIHEYHLQKAFLLVNERFHRNSWSISRISERIKHAPKTIRKGNFSYTFDAIVKNDYKAAFVKVFADPLENCKKPELEKIRMAVTIVNQYYDNHIYIFSKRRFSDYAVEQAAKDYIISLVEVDRLRF